MTSKERLIVALVWCGCRMWRGLLLLLMGLQVGNPGSVVNASEVENGPHRTSAIDSQALFAGYCMQCHGTQPRAPQPQVLRQLSADKIYETLTVGAMRTQGAMLSEKQRRNLSEWVSGQKLGVHSGGDAKDMPNQCSRGLNSLDIHGDNWTNWGVDLSNTRFQASGGKGLTRASVPSLKLRWAFALPGATSVYAQPAISGRALIVAADSGYVYALDAITGCVHWSFRANAGVRSSPTIDRWPGAKETYAVYFGDIQGSVYAIDILNGELHWKAVADPHPLARVSGAVKFYNNRLYVPVTSFEEARTLADSTYPCCTFRGSVVALDAATGNRIWKTYTLPEAPERRIQSTGAAYFGPAGAGVWNSPAIDTTLKALYFGSGNSYSGPASSQSDAVFALNLEGGKVLWTQQLLARDIWLSPGSPDQDIAASVIIRTLVDGRRVIVVAQKAMGVWAFDPDHDGALLWHQCDLDPNVQYGGSGAIIFGGAADSENVYFALTAGPHRDRGGALVALDLATGKRRWYRAVPSQTSLKDHPGITAALSMIPGVIFSGGLDGVVRAFSTLDGAEIWSFDTARSFATVNGVAGRGGSIGSSGPVIVGGRVFATSGYVGFQNGVPGNLLLAFAP